MPTYPASHDSVEPHPLLNPPELNRQVWDRAAARLLAKMLGEFAYEEIIEPERQPGDGRLYALPLDDDGERERVEAAVAGLPFGSMISSYANSPKRVRRAAAPRPGPRPPGSLRRRGWGSTESWLSGISARRPGWNRWGSSGAELGDHGTLRQRIMRARLSGRSTSAEKRNPALRNAEYGRGVTQIRLARPAGARGRLSRTRSATAPAGPTPPPPVAHAPEMRRWIPVSWRQAGIVAGQRVQV
ncbi:hypothetical protein SMICM17S_09225 [Streptomyces microflavus]